MLRDLGGLAMEMYRREQFREDLLTEQARDIANLEVRLHELDSMLAAAAAGRRTTGSRCDCGAPIIWGSHFCANCGRPVGEQPVVSCTRCGHPLPADAEFCPSCGKAAESAANGAGERKGGAPVISSSDAEADGGKEGSARPDRWEE
jgi:membrane protease subunit (stomatin/prohibitin family)